MKLRFLLSRSKRLPKCPAPDKAGTDEADKDGAKDAIGDIQIEQIFSFCLAVVLTSFAAFVMSDAIAAIDFRLF